MVENAIAESHPCRRMPRMRLRRNPRTGRTVSRMSGVSKSNRCAGDGSQSARTDGTRDPDTSGANAAYYDHGRVPVRSPNLSDDGSPEQRIVCKSQPTRDTRLEACRRHGRDRPDRETNQGSGSTKKLPKGSRPMAAAAKGQRNRRSCERGLWR